MPNNDIDPSNKELIISDCQESFQPVEVNSIEQQKSRLITANESFIDQTKTALEESVSWLRVFAELYNISPNIKDYILVPVVIMHSDLPNKNAHAFPLPELVRPDPETGLIGFETWQRKPTFADHKHDDFTKAKGINLAASLTRVTGAKGNLMKVTCLSAFDRKRDPILANQILTGERNSYSMGAWSRFFTCSICGSAHTAKVQGCEHISNTQPRLRRQPDGKLVYLQARHIHGFENSVVWKPAFHTAVSDPSKHLDMT